jgi:hypothetical protein
MRVVVTAGQALGQYVVRDCSPRAPVSSLGVKPRVPGADLHRRSEQVQFAARPFQKADAVIHLARILPTQTGFDAATQKWQFADLAGDVRP